MEKEPIEETSFESNIDLSKTILKFWSKERINSFFDERILSLQKPDDFIEKNKWQFDNFKKHLTDRNYSEEEIVKLFIQREIRNSVNYRERIFAIRDQLESKKEEILEQVRIKLAKYLPDWYTNDIEITFKIMEDADFRHPRNGEIEVDLWRLVFQDDVVENVIDGVTHELFHEWMGQGSQKYHMDEEKFSTIDDARLSACNKIVDEGLAVLIGGMSLPKHYEKQKRDYEDVVSESFTFFRDYFDTDDIEKIRKLYRKGLNNVGPFYVVGYEIAKEIIERIGLDKFRILVSKIRENPKILFDRYISQETNRVLPKI